MNQHTYRSRNLSRRTSILDHEWLKVLLFYILPFIVINTIIFFLVTAKPAYEIVVGDTTDYRTTDVTFTIKSLMPLKNVTLTLDSQPVDLVKVGNRSYRCTVDHNGVVEVYMENINGMAVSGYELVNILDDESPDVTSYVVSDGMLTLTVTDTQSGIDYDALSSTTSLGQVQAPLSVDRSTGTVVFQMDPNGLTVSIRDMSGNEYLPVFSVTQEDVDNDPETEDAQVMIQ